MVPVVREHPERIGFDLNGCSRVLKSETNLVSPPSQSTWVWEPVGEVEVVPLAVTTSDTPLTGLVFGGLSP